MKIDRDALVKAFLVDSEENLSTMEDALILLETHPEDEETLRAIFRGAHTLKGNASMLEFMELSELAHSIEDVLDRMRKQILHADAQTGLGDPARGGSHAPDGADGIGQACKVPSRDRSRFVSEALAARLDEREVALIRACEIANQDLDVTEIEKEFDGIRDEMAELWK